MKKWLLSIVLAVLVAAGGAYGWWWNQNAARAKQAVEKAIADLNSKRETVKYQSIELSGFPANITLKVTKPVVVLPMDLLVKDLNEQILAGTASASVPPALFSSVPEGWVEQYELDGALVMRGTLFTRSYEVTTEGDGTLTSTIPNAPAFSAVYHSDTPMACSVKLTRFVAFTDRVEDIAKEANLPRALELFSKLNCSAGAVTLKDRASGEVLSKLERLSLDVASDKKSASDYALKFSAVIQGSEGTAAFDTVMQRYTAAFGMDKELQPMIPYSAFGRQSAEVEMDYNGPLHLESAEGEIGALPRFTFNLSRLKMENALYRLDYTAHANSRGDEKGTLLDVKLDGTSAVDAKYDDYLRADLQRIANLIKTSDMPGMELAMLREATRELSVEEIARLGADVLPRFSAFGTVRQKIDATYEQARLDTNPPKPGKTAVHGFEFSSDLGGIKASGEVMTGGALIPAANMEITCLRCTPMVEDIAAYLRRAQAAVAKVEPHIASYAISQELVDGIKTFLTKLGTAADHDALAFSIKSADGEGMSVNGKTEQDITALFVENILSKMQPASGAK